MNQEKQITQDRLDGRGRHARTVLPYDVHRVLHHVAIELETSLSALLLEGAKLVCQRYGHGLTSSIAEGDDEVRSAFAADGAGTSTGTDNRGAST